LRGGCRHRSAAGEDKSTLQQRGGLPGLMEGGSSTFKRTWSCHLKTEDGSKRKKKTVLRSEIGLRNPHPYRGGAVRILWPGREENVHKGGFPLPKPAQNHIRCSLKPDTGCSLNSYMRELASLRRRPIQEKGRGDPYPQTLWGGPIPVNYSP